ncbi:MAG: MGH1-like glycoside hydrolase domain-containing protein, partial [Planctomycetota bacterium]
DGSIPPLWFTENETNTERLYGIPSDSSYTKDAFHRYLINGHAEAINPRGFGTRAAAHHTLNVPPGGAQKLRVRLCAADSPAHDDLDARCDHTIAERRKEADAYYNEVVPAGLSKDRRRVARQAYSSLLWTKQHYYYVVKDWLRGDHDDNPPPASRLEGRNHDWGHLYSQDILSVPDSWEYPWFAAWDLAFHTLPLARLDPDFAKNQLAMFLREWYMHPNGQIPAYEFNLSDVNPPVHAWACWRVYQVGVQNGQPDRRFLASAFQKLLLNFTWWVNRKDPKGNHLFAGGFLGLDNIGVFDRSRSLPSGAMLNQADGTAWMAFYCSIMLAIAVELAQEDSVYEDMASKFFEHFIAIADAMNTLGETGLYDETDGFYYDMLRTPHGDMPMRVRSMVGIIPLFAVAVADRPKIQKLVGFRKRSRWIIDNRPDLAQYITFFEKDPADANLFMLALPSRQRLESVLRYVLDEDELLGEYGVRSLSKAHAERPFRIEIDGQTHSVAYSPAESETDMFGGNSNWRGPIWFPLNQLLIESLIKYHQFFGDSFQIECPTRSGRLMNLEQVAKELSRRLVSIFDADSSGRRPLHGYERRYADYDHFKELILFYEYFHGDTGRGLGASHQTGWTALITENLRHLADTV